MTRYTTLTDAIQAEIIDPIEAGDATADEFDIDAIADEIFVYDDQAPLDQQGFVLRDEITPDDFWDIVFKHMVTE